MKGEQISACTYPGLRTVARYDCTGPEREAESERVAGCFETVSHTRTFTYTRPRLIDARRQVIRRNRQEYVHAPYWTRCDTYDRGHTLMEVLTVNAGFESRSLSGVKGNTQTMWF